MTVNDIYKMYEEGITLDSGTVIAPQDLFELRQIFRINYGINSYEYVKENIEDVDENGNDIVWPDVIDHNIDFYEGIYDTMQELITGDDEYQIVVRACREENK